MEQGGGFRGSPAGDKVGRCLTQGDLPMTYTALLSLTILRDDYVRLDKEAIKAHVRDLQQADGSFLSTPGYTEHDVRFSYCAFAISYLLNDWSFMDMEKAVQYMLQCQHYEGAFAQEPGLESHAGSTYCVVAALALAQRLDVIPYRERLEQWVLSRQVSWSGFQGRVEKEPDTCYSFWCGATAKILGCHAAIDAISDVRYILSAQSPMGGIAKVPGNPPDIIHSYLSYVALSMHQHDQYSETALPLLSVSPAINLSEPSIAWLQRHLW